MRRSRVRRFLPFGVLAMVLLPMIVTSSQPRMPPSHSFTASGIVVPEGGSAVNYTVVLMGRGGHFSSEWDRLDLVYRSNECNQVAAYVSITRNDGAFKLSACLLEAPDSLAAAVVLPDTIIMGTPVLTTRLSRYEEEASDVVDGFLCDDTVSYIAYYVYERIDSLIVAVP